MILPGEPPTSGAFISGVPTPKDEHALNVAVAVMWLIPDRRFSRART